MVYVQAALILRFGGQQDPVRSEDAEIADDLLKSRLTVSLALFVPVDHEAPQVFIYYHPL